MKSPFKFSAGRRLVQCDVKVHLALVSINSGVLQFFKGRYGSFKVALNPDPATMRDKSIEMLL